jgi:hypothetical protein
MNTKKTTKKAAPAKAVKATIAEVTEAPEAVTEAMPTVEDITTTEAAQAPTETELDVTATEVAEAAQAPTEAPVVKATEAAPTATQTEETVEATEEQSINAEELAAIDAGLDAAEASIEAIEQTVKPTKTAKVEKVAKPTSERYEAAVAEVSKYNQLFLNSLDRKAALIGNGPRVNESVGVYNHPDAARLNEDIRRCRMELEALLERKRNLKVQAEGMEEINAEVSKYRKARDKARQEKKAAMTELTGTAHSEAIATEQEAQAEAA